MYIAVLKKKKNSSIFIMYIVVLKKNVALVKTKLNNFEDKFFREQREFEFHSV